MFHSQFGFEKKETVPFFLDFFYYESRGSDKQDVVFIENIYYAAMTFDFDQSGRLGEQRKLCLSYFSPRHETGY